MGRSDKHSSGSSKGNWKSSLYAALLVAVILGGMIGMIIWFPSYQIALMFYPAVTQADTAQPGHWIGRRAADDIPRLTSLSQLEDGSYDSLTYLTVETDHIIPLSYYELKDSSYSRRSSRRSRRRPLPVYTHSPTVNVMYYAQYCVVELEDGSYIGAYLDSSYSTLFGKVQLPIGQVSNASNVGKELFTEAAALYSIPTDRMLTMHDDSYYKKINLLDIGIRILAVVLVPVVVFACIFVKIIIKKRNK